MPENVYVEKLLIDYTLNYLNKKQIKGIIVDVGARLCDWTEHVRVRMPNQIINCFEPDFLAYNYLNYYYDDDKNIKIYNCGIGDENKRDKFYFVKEIPGLSSFVYRDIFRDKKIITQEKIIPINIEERVVNLYRLDNLYDVQNLSFLKIDTEGYEYKVLLGAEKLLKNKQIEFIQFEYGSIYNEIKIEINTVIDFLNHFNYKVYDFKKEIPTLVDKLEDDYKLTNFLATKNPIEYI